MRSQYSRNLQQPDLLQKDLIRGWLNAQHRYSTRFAAMLQMFLQNELMNSDVVELFSPFQQLYTTCNNLIGSKQV